MRAHLIGGGIASMAAAVYLIREAGYRGEDIVVYERTSGVGGSLAVLGDADIGYIYPGGRVMEHQYRCATDLFSAIPSCIDPSASIWEDVLTFNAEFGWEDHARLIGEDGLPVRQGPMGIGARDQLNMLRLLLTPEQYLQGKSVEDCVSPALFRSAFWIIWSAFLGFRPKHGVIEMRRYMLRFMHILPKFWDLTFILRTRFNQHQAIVEPIQAWLHERGVQIETGISIEDISLTEERGGFAAVDLRTKCDGGEAAEAISVQPGDLVFVTNGSQVANMTVGSMDAPPAPSSAMDPWMLWRRLAAKRPGLGNPGAVADNTHESTWYSFTVTDRGRLFADRMEKLSGSEAGRGGLMTLRCSNWLITLTRFHHPNAIGQPDDAFVWWGFGIFPERPGNLTGKTMFECTGEEILREVLFHLRFGGDTDEIVRTSICRPCLLPYGNSVFLYQNLTDRPPVVPQGARNLAFIGQFCEQPSDTVFTIEYSIRSAWTAVHRLTGKGRPPPPVYKGYRDPRVLWRAARTMMR